MAGLKGLTATERKQRPIFSGVIKYFPDALAEVAYVSYIGNEQHNPGQPLHWDKSKSSDETDAEVRHMIDGIDSKYDSDGVRHKAKKAWRALADLQREIDTENNIDAPDVCACDNCKMGYHKYLDQQCTCGPNEGCSNCPR